MNKKSIATILIILGIIILSIIVLNKAHPETQEESVKCIGQNSELYIQLGCHACTKQEEIFGENKKYLNIIDCWYEREKCSKIEYTPTWIIKEEKYIGIQSFEKLKELTGC